ncbi:glycosyltransferase family 4 protein [Marinobacterium rhizophilum]|uniref:glycosyltransferase family 4 protein n=1 Tax=Marinobacterium rhizophilum TaxID=420402 RepID=UPI000A0732C1|nr:glycosyltransferase family 4 protein [Marinobacterium rhizophilum]
MSGSTRSYEMARRLVESGHEVHMITSWRESHHSEEWFTQMVDGIHVHWLPVFYANSMGFFSRVRAFFRFALAAAFKSASFRDADVIFATSTPLTIALPGVYASRRLGIPMVFEVRDLWPELPIAIGALRNPLLCVAARWLERFAYRNAERIVALSPGMKEGVVRAGYPTRSVSIIPNSADLALFNPEGYRPAAFEQRYPELAGCKLVVYAGTLGRVNGVGYLVDIAAECLILMPECRFAIFGQGQERDAVLDKASQLGVLGRNLYLYEPVSKNEMPQVLGASDIAVSLFIDLKPMWANSANKFFDALASGTAVALNYGGWQATLIEESGAGLVLSTHDPRAAAASLVTFLKDEPRLRIAGQQALRLARERFDRDRLAAELEQVLKVATEKYCKHE